MPVSPTYFLALGFVLSGFAGDACIAVIVRQIFRPFGWIRPQPAVLFRSHE